MDTISIILMVVVALIAAAATYFICRKKMAVPLNLFVSKDEHEQIMQELHGQLTALDGQKSQMEKQLSEAKENAKSLSDRLTLLTSSGQVDPELMAKLTDVDRLKKKVKQLEDDLDEAQEDLDDANKKLKNKTNDFLNLQDNLHDIEKNLQQKQEELTQVQQDLEDKVSLMKLKDESLFFVQHILSAEEFSDSSTFNLYRKVDVLSDFIQGELLDSMKQIWDLKDDSDVVRLLTEDVNRWEAVQKKNWISGKTAIAFVGEFSAGKTSIVNRILSGDDSSVPLLPVSAKATTAIPTYISGGPKTDYKFFSQNNKLKKIDAEVFSRITKEVLDQVGGVSNLIQYFVMTYKNENLDNLSILDTPGFNSNDKEDATRTLGVINECDALFWVFDVNSGTVNKSSIDLIKHHLKKPLYVVINKTDTKADSEVKKVEQLIKDTFKREGVAVEKFIRFSSKAPLDNIMTPIKSVKSTSGEDQYLNLVNKEIKNAVSAINQFVKKKNTEFDNCRKNADALTEKYNKAIASTYDDCETAVNIPHFESHLFKKDNYEMSQYEYSQLETILNRIATSHMVTLCNIYNQAVEAQQSVQSAYEALQEARGRVRLMDNCEKQFNKYKHQLTLN